MHKLKVLFLVFLFTFFKLSAQNSYSIQNYTIKKGLPDNNVLGLFYEKNGYVWVVYGSGLARFDGINFKKHFTSDAPYLGLYFYQTTNADKIMIEPSGNIFQIKGLTSDTLRKGKINSLNYINIKGTLPDIKTYLELSTPHVNITVDKSWILTPLIMFPLPDNSYIVRTKKGIAHFKGKNKLKELNLDHLQNRKFISANGNIYVFANDSEIYRVDLTSWSLVKCKLKGDLSSCKNYSRKITNTFWDFNNSDPCVQVDYTLYSFFPDSLNANLISTVQLTNQLPNNCLISSIIYNEDQNLIMIGTDTRGLFVYKKRNFKSLEFANPEPGTNNTYFCQIALNDSTVYIDWNREFTINGGKQSKLNLARNYSENICIDKKGNYWYAENNSLVRFNPKTKAKKYIYYTGDELPLSFFEEGDTMWVGLIKSFGCVVNDTLKHIKILDNDESNSNIFQLLRFEGKLWICNYTGIYKYDTQSGKLDTLPELALKYTYHFKAINNYLLIGTYGRGYYMYKNGKTVKMPNGRFEALRQVHNFVPDSLGFLWMATNNGVIKTKFAELVHYFNDTTYQVSYFHYSEEDGISNPEFNGGCDPNYLRLNNGYVSLPNVEGLVWFYPEKIEDPRSDYPISIDQFIADDSIYYTSNNIKVPNSVQYVRIEFSNPYWGEPENLFCEYKLEGYNKQWIYLSPNESALEFSNLKSGEYKFTIRKQTGLSKDYTEATIAFHIENKYYETIWFWLAMVGLALLIIIIVARIYAFNIRRKNILLEKNVVLRTSELQTANNELSESIKIKDKLISIISHDLITPLRFITMVAKKGASEEIEMDNKKHKELLGEIENTTEKLQANAENILNWIKHQNKRIKKQISSVAIGALAEDITEQFMHLTYNKGTRLISTISHDDIIQSDSNLLSIILHNIISNATKFTENGFIKIYSKQNNQYEITIEDNGKGMSEQQLTRITKLINKQPLNEEDEQLDNKEGFGLGYIIISELVQILNGKIEVQSKLGLGTKVTISLPLTYQ